MGSSEVGSAQGARRVSVGRGGGLFFSRTEMWVLEIGSLKSAGMRCRKAQLSCNAAFPKLQRSVNFVAAQLFGKKTSTLQKSTCCSATFQSATFLKLQCNLCLWHVAGAGFVGAGLRTC